MTYQEYKERGILEWHAMTDEPINKDTKLWFIAGCTGNSKIRVGTWNQFKRNMGIRAVAWAYPIPPTI